MLTDQRGLELKQGQHVIIKWGDQMIQAEVARVESGALRSTIQQPDVPDRVQLVAVFNMMEPAGSAVPNVFILAEQEDQPKKPVLIV